MLWLIHQPLPPPPGSLPEQPQSLLARQNLQCQDVAGSHALACGSKQPAPAEGELRVCQIAVTSPPPPPASASVSPTP